MIERLEDRRMLSADLSATFPGRLPAALPVDGTSVINVHLTNHGSSIAQGTAQVELFASTDAMLDAGDFPVVTKPIHVRLRPRGAENVRLSFATPTSLADGEYYLLAELQGSTAVVGSPAVAASSAPVSIQSPFSDLSLQFASLPTLPIEIDGASAGRRVATVFVTNTGNIPIRGKVDASLYLSTDNVLDSTDSLLATAKNRPIALKPGRHAVTGFRIAVPPGTAVGGYFLIAEITPTGTLVDSNAADNVAVSSRRVAVVTQLPQPQRNHGGYGSGAEVDTTGYVVTGTNCPPVTNSGDDSSDDISDSSDDGSQDNSSDTPDASTDSSDSSSSDSSPSPSSDPSTSSSDSSSSSDDSTDSWGDGSDSDGGDF